MEKNNCLMSYDQTPFSALRNWFPLRYIFFGEASTLLILHCVSTTEMTYQTKQYWHTWYQKLATLEGAFDILKQFEAKQDTKVIGPNYTKCLLPSTKYEVFPRKKVFDWPKGWYVFFFTCLCPSIFKMSESLRLRDQGSCPFSDLQVVHLLPNTPKIRSKKQPFIGALQNLTRKLSLVPWVILQAFAKLYGSCDLYRSRHDVSFNN